MPWWALSCKTDLGHSKLLRRRLAQSERQHPSANLPQNKPPRATTNDDDHDDDHDDHDDYDDYDDNDSEQANERTTEQKLEPLQ